MPLFPLSSRQSTVNYAIDLLRAHQIRRENVFLHEQLKACLNEVSSLRDEIRDLKANNIISAVSDEIKNVQASIEADNSTVTKALALASKHGLLLEEQSRELEIIRRSRDSMSSDIADIKNSLTKSVEDERAKRILLEDQVNVLRGDCQSLVAAQHQQSHDVQLTFESFQTALDEKADVAALSSLESGLDEVRLHLPAERVALPPMSRVSESVQVRDSQHQNDLDRTDTSPEPLKPHAGIKKPAETVPEDLDLDANVDTISYAGHHRDTIRQPESLHMLPLPLAQATQLAEVKTLRQRRFDDWSSYYGQGQKLLENLPSSFEETVVHNFVEGIFLATHRNQCRQWLDSNGWSWANITTFGNLSSQVAQNSAFAAIDAPEQLAQPTQMKKMLAVRTPGEKTPGSGQPNAGERAHQNTPMPPLRRSQRLVEKDNLMNSLRNSPVPARKASPLGRSAVGLKDRTSTKSSGMRSNDKPKVPQDVKKQLPSITTGDEEVQENQDKGKKGSPAQRRTAAIASREIAETDTVLPASITKRKTAHAGEDRPPKRAKSKSKRKDHNIPMPRVASAGRIVAKLVAESSDDEGFLHQDIPAKPSTSTKVGGVRGKRRLAKYHAYGAGRQGKSIRKHERLPLPPPPQIPILDTTEEE